MRPNLFSKILNSVFIKLLLVFITTGICMTLLVGGFFRHTILKTRQISFQNNIIRYLNYLIQDMGTPPSLKKAKLIAKQASLEIQYDSPQISWTTSDVMLSVDQLYLDVWQDNPLIKGKFRHGNHIVAIACGDGWFVFSLKSGIMAEIAKEIPLFCLILIITLPVVIAYLAIRQILKPLQYLSEGVRQISSGNMEHQVPCSKSDELGQLSDTFNRMIVQIRNMLNAKEQLLLDVSHELRSPITRMKVALEFFPNIPAKKSVKEDISEIEKMITGILETARLRNNDRHLNLEMTNIGKLTEDVANRYKYQRPGVSICNKSDNITLNIDPDLTKTVLNNIIGNAIKYSDDSSEPVRITIQLKPEYGIIQIADRGVGIPVEDLPYIFEPFYRVDKSRNKRTGGYGLGLNLCKTIMEAHHGKIEIESSSKCGTVVSLFFKICQYADTTVSDASFL